MLTRLEVDGFKNLRGVVIEFGPFTCIAGENGAGKSNVFDAIEFLSLLASHSLMEAAQRIRSTRDDRSGDPRDLFWRGSARSTGGVGNISELAGTGRLMSLAAEMIIPERVEDDFGRQAKASITFVRYEVDISHEPPTGLQKIGRLVLARESLTPIRLSDAPRRLGFRHSVKSFRRNALKGRRSGGPFISTRKDEGDQVIVVHQDGGSRGKPKPASAARAPATVVSTVTGADDPTILAARREMQSWRRLALEPSALRASDRYHDPRVMAIDGRHLPAALFRIATRQPASGAAPDPDGTYARVTNRLTALTGVGVRRVLVDTDDMRELITLLLEESNGVELPARSLSEGTLRFLALSVLSEDPDIQGIICMEEPENGMHPANLGTMVDLLRDLAFDPFDETGDENPFRQVIANTHSPSLVQILEPEELLFASADFAPCGNGEIARALRLAPLKGTWRDERLDVPPVTKADILPYLTSPVGTQLSIESIPA